MASALTIFVVTVTLALLLGGLGVGTYFLIKRRRRSMASSIPEQAPVTAPASIPAPTPSTEKVPKALVASIQMNPAQVTDPTTLLTSPKPAPVPVPKPAPVPAAPKPAPVPVPKPAPVPAPKPAPKPAPVPAPKPAPKPAPIPAPKPAPIAAAASSQKKWLSGTATYYTPEVGNRGADGSLLVPFKSVAVKEKEFKKRKGKKLEIQGLPGEFVVNDLCQGPACKTLDIYVGSLSDAKRIPNWELGNIPIKYRWL